MTNELTTEKLFLKFVRLSTLDVRLSTALR